MANKPQPNFVFKDNYGVNYKALRERVGLTQKELAEKLHMVHSTISDIEHSKNPPTIEQLQAYHDYFHVSYEFLLGETPVSNRNVQEICDYIGLSEMAVKTLIALTDHNKESHTKIIETKEFKDIAVYLQDLEKLSAIVLNCFGENSNNPENLHDLQKCNKECNVLKYLADNSFRKIIERFDLRNTCETDIDFALNGRL